MRRITNTISYVIAAILVSGPVLGQEDINVSTFLDKLRTVIDYRQNEIDAASVLNTMPLNQESYLREGDARTRCYFDFGRVEEFLTIANDGLDRVAVDPGYLDALGFKKAQAIYQKVGGLTVTFQAYEQKYERAIVLRKFVPEIGTETEDSTEIHEAIHAAAASRGPTDIDLDYGDGGDDAPEYISSGFFVEQEKLIRIELKALKRVNDILAEAQAATNSEGADSGSLAKWATEQIYISAREYLENIKQALVDSKRSRLHVHETAEELMSWWGGKADWDGLIADAEKNVATLRAIAVAVSKGEEITGLPDSFSYFFFKQKCAPD